MKLGDRFIKVIREQNLFSTGDRLLLAVSGGVDSVVLCELCARAGFAFAIAHCNFRLRGKESKRDRKFVKALAKKYKVEFFLKEFDTETYASEKKISIQEAARELRYSWFAELLKKPAAHHDKKGSPLAFRHLITAHHADDNIETLLMNFCRGTGLTGLQGIPARSPQARLRRPLLGFWKKELLAFAKKNELDYVEDSSNSSSKYTRNFFRNTIIPQIEKVYPALKNNLVDNISRFRDIHKLYAVAVAEVKKKLQKIKGSEIHIPVKKLMSYRSRALVYEIIRDHGFTEKQVDELFKLAESGSGKFIRAPQGPARIIRHGNWFIITTAKNPATGNIIIEETNCEIHFDRGTLRVSDSKPGTEAIANSNSVARVDAKDIRFPLLLRPWKTGDYFYPLGMRKKKKLARFFIDQKLSLPARENILVLEMDGKIIWIPGQRLDDRFKITPATKKILRLEIIPAE